MNKRFIYIYIFYFYRMSDLTVFLLQKFQRFQYTAQFL